MRYLLHPAGLTLLFITFLCTCVRAQNFAPPVNDIVSDRESVQAPPLEPAPLRAADIMWQKRVWRVIDVKEKINHPFTYQERPLASILLDAGQERRIELYSPIDDKFSTPLSDADRLAIAGGLDTVAVFDETGDYTYEVVPREFNPATVTRYRIQEMHYFNRKTSRQEVRILGIAPIIDELDELGNVVFERPLFWVYYPAARTALGKEQAYVAGNDAANRSWADVFESRLFSSYVMKESNVHNRRIEDYLPAGRDRLLASDRVEGELLNREQDGWSY